MLASRINGLPEGLRLPTALLTDELRLEFFLGVGFIIIGLLRNRKAKQFAGRAEAVAMEDSEPGNGDG